MCNVCCHILIFRTDFFVLHLQNTTFAKEMEKDNKPQRISLGKGLTALSPLFVFLGLFVFLSIIAGDFYGVPITVAFLAASVYAVGIVRGERLEERMEVFSKGAARPDLLFMIWIFVLAGAFAASAKDMGAVEAIVEVSLRVLPPQLILTGLFLAACFISISIGTSVGTIVALVPIAQGMAQQTGNSLPLIIASVVGGAFFGDNLSFISDTTIVATRSQGCRMSEKFRANLRIALPAALLTIILYIILGSQFQMQYTAHDIQWVLMIPYLLVLGTALAGVNVMGVLLLGILSTGVIGMLSGSYNLFQWLKAMGDGIMGMSELIIVTLLAAGLVNVIRHMGGIDFLLQRLSAHISSRRGGELCIAVLTVLTDLCTANNTIAILTVAPLAKEISIRYGIAPQRTASILDTFSCFAQGLIPYGAQLLMASSIALINPLDIIPYLYYPFILGACALGFIFVGKKE